MGHLLERLPSGSRIAVIRLRSLGDCVLTTPALALLKSYRPDLKLSVVVEPRFAAVFEGNPDVDEIRFDAPRADLALNLHGGTRSMWLALRSRRRAGFAHHRYSFIYSHKIPRAQEILGVERTVHTTEHLASAMFWLGVPRTEILRAKLFAGPPPALPPYMVIHPFASHPEKTWPAERFVKAARDLNLHPVFLAGPSDDASAFRSFEVWENIPLARVKALISGAALFLGNDSGPAHIAAAFGVPSIVIFGASDPAIWGPWRTESQILASPEIKNISIADVVAAAEALKVRA
ncbi:MAG: glycosyltransferase family 9 protein [Bryobacteraceae bacterium]